VKGQEFHNFRMEFNDLLLLRVFFSFAKFLTKMTETHGLLTFCLRLWFDTWLQLSLSSPSFSSSAKWWKGKGETNYLG